MRKSLFVIAAFLVLGLIASSYSSQTKYILSESDSLRALYARPVTEWPRPNIDAGVQWQEFAPIPKDTTWMLVDKDPKTHLGMLLFFDPRLSSSNQISCSSCHDPDEAWQDGKVVALGHDHLQGTRNTPSLLNSFIFKKMFWDGRADGFDEQAILPLATHHEMNMEPPLLAKKLKDLKVYDSFFVKAYGDKNITLSRITGAIAAFENTIRSRATRFDKFLIGDYDELTDDEIKGLHLFRTKARCMNCHFGTYFTDLGFHNVGLTYYGRKYEDLGRYNVTKNPADVGRFKTPSLRELLHTSPWMHNGLFNNLEGIINMYNSGMPQLPKTDAQRNDPLFPKTDTLLKPLNLTKTEIRQLMAFVQTLSGVPYRMRRPELPK
ncbi:MAG: cytochrome c peroxidase [Niabella sp.]